MFNFDELPPILVNASEQLKRSYRAVITSEKSELNNNAQQLANNQGKYNKYTFFDMCMKNPFPYMKNKWKIEIFT